MQVFVIPIGQRGYELYYENPEVSPADRKATGIRARLQAMLAEADERRRNPESAARSSERAGRLERARRWALCWMAERIAEQRLLWHLRKETAAALFYPADLSDTDAHRIVRATLQRDFDRHLRALVLNSIALILSAALIVLPGPNAIGYYFLFMVVSNFLSMRGARQGLRRVAWEAHPSDVLVELRHAIALDGQTREARVLDVASRLHLQHLATFFERVAPLPSA